MGKRSDGMSLIPWENGKSLVWDATCRDTLAPSYRHLSSGSAGLVAEAIENNFFFVPFAVESLGPWCNDAKMLNNAIGRLISSITGDTKSTNYLIQRIGIEIQRHIAACIMGSLPLTSVIHGIFYVLEMFL